METSTERYALRLPAQLVGGVIGGGVGLGIGVGLTALALVPFKEPPTRYNEYDELESGCEWGCYTGERILISVMGGVLTLGTTVFGAALGTWGTGALLGGHGTLVATLIGVGVGAVTQGVFMLAVLAADVSSDAGIVALIASSTLPFIGALVGYEVTHARWKPQLGVAPDGTGAYVGASVSF